MQSWLSIPGILGDWVTSGSVVPSIHSACWHLLWPVGPWVQEGRCEQHVQGGKRHPAASLFSAPQPRLGFLACACSNYVSACLCPVSVCGGSPAPRVCTFCVHPASCLDKCVPDGVHWDAQGLSVERWRSKEVRSRSRCGRRQVSLVTCASATEFVDQNQGTSVHRRCWLWENL